MGRTGARWSKRSSATSAPQPSAAAPRLESGTIRIDQGHGQPWSLDPPPALGRGIVVSGDAVVPAAWRCAPRIVVDAAVLGDPSWCLGTLRDLSERRIGAVVVIDEPAAMVLSRRPSRDESLQPARAGTVAALEALRWMIWSNSIDLRPGRFGWWAIERAVQLGARLPTPAESVASDPKGDLCTPDGRWCWIDAGPARLTVIEGAAVVSGISLEHGSLEPAGSAPARAELSVAQRAAVEEPSGAARVIAPAGSGKTRVLTERARYLIDTWRIPASAITLLAFNRRARDELVERTADLPGLQIRTLNSIALAIINGTTPFAAQPTERRTMDDDRSNALLSEAIWSVTRQVVTNELIETYREAFVRIRLRLRTPQEVAEQFSERAPSLVRAWVRYRAALERNGAIDFDGQIHLALEVLSNDPVARQQAQRSCRLLLVDEFQDLTPAHMALIRLLTGPGGSIYGVGDDDQTIYGYAGARPEWLIDPAALDGIESASSVRHQLDVNHRCPAEVVSAVSALLEHNRRRARKQIAAVARAPQRRDDDGLELIGSDDPLADTVNAVRDAVRAGVPPSSIAVLARVNALLVPVHVELTAAGVPVNTPGPADFTRHRVVAAIRAWWVLSTARPGARVDPADLLAIVPDRSRARSRVGAVSDARALRGLRYREDLRTRDLLGLSETAGAIGAMAAMLRSARGAVADGASSSAWLEVLSGGGRQGAPPGRSVLPPGHDHLTALQQLATRTPDVEDFGEVIERIGGLQSSDHGVVLSTIHRVKGLEWPMVVLHQADAARLPHRLADDVEEERRIFHVGLTRAVERCVVVTGNDPSPFVAELASRDT